MSSASSSSASASSSATPEQLASLPVVAATIQLEGGDPESAMWGRNSVKLVVNSALGHLKALCVKLLVSGTVDRQNATPHINVDGDRTVAAMLHMTGLQLRFEHMRIRDSFIDIDVGYAKHYTLAYRRGLREQPHLQHQLIAIWKQWAELIAAHPDPPPRQPLLFERMDVIARKRHKDVKEDACGNVGPSSLPAAPAEAIPIVPVIVHVNETVDECKICMSAPLSCLIDCPHFCMCFDCAKQVDACPICRTPITVRIQKRVIMS